MNLQLEIRRRGSWTCPQGGFWIIRLVSDRRGEHCCVLSSSFLKSVPCLPPFSISSEFITDLTWSSQSFFLTALPLCSHIFPKRGALGQRCHLSKRRWKLRPYSVSSASFLKPGCHVIFTIRAVCLSWEHCDSSGISPVLCVHELEAQCCCLDSWHTETKLCVKDAPLNAGRRGKETAWRYMEYFQCWVLLLGQRFAFFSNVSFFRADSHSCLLQLYFLCSFCCFYTF